jgi:uncharacterized membrane protein
MPAPQTIAWHLAEQHQLTVSEATIWRKLQQVSDTTVRDRRILRTALSHALLSYVFGVAIVGGSVNLIAGLIH